MQMSARDWTLLVVLSLLWGGAFFFVAVAVKQVPPLTVVLVRVGLAALVLFVYLRLRRQALPFGGQVMVACLAMGLLNNVVPFSLLFWAQTGITSGLASILNATTPIFSILVAHVALVDERLRAHKLAGVVLGVAGVAVLIGGDAVFGENESLPGMIACLGAAFSYGLASVYGRRFKAMGVSSGAGALGQLAASTLVMLPVAALVDRPWTLPMPALDIVLSLVGLAVVSTAGAYLIFFRLLASAGAVNVALVTLLIPVSAIALGTAVLNEELNVRQVLGMALIAAGLIAVDGRLIAKMGRAGNRR
jgi:drug/metabolite transporter (DMT)-like permease